MVCHAEMFLVSQVEEVSEGKIILYAEPFLLQEECESYQCLFCEYVLTDKQGNPIKTEKEVVDWVKRHCPQQG